MKKVFPRETPLYNEVTTMQAIKGILHNAFVMKKAYDTLWDEIMDRYELTRAEIDVIAFLAVNPEKNTAHEIVEYRMIAKSHVSKAVDSLLARGLLTREKDQNDRRCMHLTLTEPAAEIVREIEAKQNEFSAKLIEGLTETELTAFTKMTARIAENAEKMI